MVNEVALLRLTHKFTLPWAQKVLDNQLKFMPGIFPMLHQHIHLKYYNQQYNIGLVDLKSALLLEKELVELHPSVYKSHLIYRLPKT